MLYILHSEYTWFFLYSSLLLIFIVNIALGKPSKQDIILLGVLLCSSIFNLALEDVQVYILQNKSVMFEVMLLIVSFSLVTKAYSKKLLFYLFSVTIYFSGLAVSHALHLESLIIPVVSLLMIFCVYRTHISLPDFCHAKNGVYFMLPTMIVIQNLFENAKESIYFAITYVFFACYLAIKAFCEKEYHSKVFYAFLSFFVLTVANVFLEVNILNIAEYTILYSVVAYFLYNTIGRKEKLNFIFIFHTILAFIHICFTIINPSYFLIHATNSQMLLYPALQFVTIFIYFTIFLSIIQAIVCVINNVQIHRKIDWVKLVCVSVGMFILVQTEIVHKVLSNTNEMINISVFPIIILHMFYLGFSYLVLLLLKLVFERTSIPKLPKFKISQIEFLFPKKFFNIKLRNMLFIIDENIRVIHKNAFALIPIFLLFYLIISFIY